MEILKGDIEVWLTTKLEYQWSSENISSLLTKEILQGSYEIYPLLESSIKIKYLFSFVTLRKQSVIELKDYIYPIIEQAKNDTDMWVNVVAEQIEPIIRGIEKNMTCNQNKELISPIFEVKISELQKVVEEIQTQTFAYYQKQINRKNNNNNNVNEMNDDVISPLDSSNDSKEREGYYPMEFGYLNKRLYPPIARKNYHFSIKENKNDLIIDWENISISEYLSAHTATPSLSSSSNLLFAPTPSAPSSLSPPRNNGESKRGSAVTSSSISSTSSSPFGRPPSLLSSSSNRNNLFPSNNNSSKLNDRRKRMRMIEIDELPVDDLNNNNIDKKRKKLNSSSSSLPLPLEEGGGFENDKMRKKRERMEELQRKKDERDAKKRKKQEEIEFRKLQKEEKRAEKEAMREAKKKEKEQMSEVKKFSKISNSPLPSKPKTMTSPQFNSSSLFPSSILSSIGSLNAQGEGSLLADTLLNPPTAPSLLSSQPLHPFTPSFSSFPYVHSSPLNSSSSSAFSSNPNNPNNPNPNTSMNSIGGLSALGLSKPLPPSLSSLQPNLNLNLNLSNINFANTSLQRNPTPNPNPLSANPNPNPQHSFESLFPEANRINVEQRKIITNFLEGKQSNYPIDNPTVQILLNEKQVNSEDGRLWLEQILFEMNYSNGSWRKLRRRKAL